MFLAFNCHFPYEKGDKQYGKREKKDIIAQKIIMGTYPERDNLI